jgi:hypothetical protein
LKIEYPDIQPFYEAIFNKAINDEQISKEVDFVRCFFEEWAGNFLHPFGDDLMEAKNGNAESLLYCYLASQSMTFDWLAHTLLFANYQTTLRELRTILENSFFMYSVDSKYITASADEKLKKIEQEDLPYGKPVFENSGYSNWRESYALYKELCQYTHVHMNASLKMAKEIAKRGLPEALEVEYNRQSFIQCSTAWRKVARVCVSLAVDLESRIQPRFQQLDSERLFRIW